MEELTARGATGAHTLKTHQGARLIVGEVKEWGPNTNVRPDGPKTVYTVRVHVENEFGNIIAEPWNRFVNANDELGAILEAQRMGVWGIKGG